LVKLLISQVANYKKMRKVGIKRTKKKEFSKEISSRRACFK
jgi:hypothetical protein